MNLGIGMKTCDWVTLHTLVKLHRNRHIHPSCLRSSMNVRLLFFPHQVTQICKFNSKLLILIIYSGDITTSILKLMLCKLRLLENSQPKAHVQILVPRGASSTYVGKPAIQQPC